MKFFNIVKKIVICGIHNENVYLMYKTDNVSDVEKDY